MTLSWLGQWPYEIHPNPPEWHLNNRKWYQGGRGWLLRGSSLTHRTGLAEPSHLRIDSWPMEMVPEPLKSVFCCEVASHWVGVNQRNYHISFPILAKWGAPSPLPAWLPLNITNSSLPWSAEKVGRRQRVFSLYNSDLFQAMPESVILTLLIETYWNRSENISRWFLVDSAALISGQLFIIFLLLQKFHRQAASFFFLHPHSTHRITKSPSPLYCIFGKNIMAHTGKNDTHRDIAWLLFYLHWYSQM